MFQKLTRRFMPNPSASSNTFWPCSNIFYCSNIFDHGQICKFLGKILLVFKKYGTCSKKFERSKNIFWTSRWNRHLSILKIVCPNTYDTSFYIKRVQNVLSYQKLLQSLVKWYIFCWNSDRKSSTYSMYLSWNRPLS